MQTSRKMPGPAYPSSGEPARDPAGRRAVGAGRVATLAALRPDAAVADFAREARRMLADLHAAAVNVDLAALRTAAHELDGLATGAGADLVSEACRRLEAAAAEQDVYLALATVRTLAAEVRRADRELARAAC